MRGLPVSHGNESQAGKMNLYPHEIAIGGVYLPPLLIAALLGTIAAIVTARQLNHYRLARYFFYPPLVFVAMMVIYTVLIGTFVIGV
jgi:hypothetical protein